MNESLESVKIIQQLFLSFSTDCIPCIVSSAVMESMIEGFRFITNLMLGETYLRQEAPKGELGLYIGSPLGRTSLASAINKHWQRLNQINLH